MMDLHNYYQCPPQFPSRRGAGGVVARVMAGGVLIALVKERELPQEFYVLPKGGLEPGETWEAAAAREVHEEAGLDAVKLLCLLEECARQNFKRTYWQTTRYFLFYTEQESGMILDTDHHDEVAWFPLDALPPMYWRDETELLVRHRSRIVRETSAASLR
ncbi:MAG: NUDIX hydrolase [Candidatus Hydrogenedentales bacterium]